MYEYIEKWFEKLEIKKKSLKILKPKLKCSIKFGENGKSSLKKRWIRKINE